jgi:hypothetical protein
MESTGLYLPHVLETVMRVLQSGPLLKKHSRKAGIEGSIDLGYRLTPADLKNTNILNDIFNKAVFSIYWFCSLLFKMAAGV